MRRQWGYIAAEGHPPHGEAIFMDIYCYVYADCSCLYSFCYWLFSFTRITSRKTARMMTQPTATCCQKELRPIRFSPLLRIPMINAPMIVPIIFPFPPDKLAPPMTAAAMAKVSSPCPATGEAEATREVRMIPATEERKPQSRYTLNFVQFTLIPLQ